MGVCRRIDRRAQAQVSASAMGLVEKVSPPPLAPHLAHSPQIKEIEGLCPPLSPCLLTSTRGDGQDAEKQGPTLLILSIACYSHPKATEYHLGLLKAKLARYRAQLLEPSAKSGPAGVGFDVQKSGDARVALIGFPSVGKVCIGIF